MIRPSFRVAFVSVLIVTVACPTWADDWPTYRHDAGRSGISAESLSAPLSEDWTFVPTFPPSHAWGDPQPVPIEKNLELPRMRFDDAFHVAVAKGLVTFGSSADNTVYALDARDGRIRWTFTTDGPVRTAPTVTGGKVYVGSDDGNLYGLSASDGRLLWTFPGAPRPDKVLGNGRMTSLWPIRTGVVVDGGVAYFGAGVFPAEGLYLYAVAADSGRLIWKNDSYGRGGRGEISPQGYLVASKQRLFVSSGRAMPAAFDRTDGRFLFHRNFSWRGTGLFGGTYNVLAGNLLFNGTEQITAVWESNGQFAFNEQQRAATPSTGSRRIVLAADTVYMLNGKEAVAVERDSWISPRTAHQKAKDAVDRLNRDIRATQALAKSDKNAAKRLGDLKKRLQDAVAKRNDLRGRVAKGAQWLWRTACTACDAVALAGNTLFVGGPDTVIAFDTANGKQVWSGKVRGRARGLAVAGGRLFVSTDTGAIHCFVEGSAGKGAAVTQQSVKQPFPKDDRTDTFPEVAGDLVKEFGITRGFALMLGGDGRLALELARRTDLLIYVVDPDARRVATMRRALSDAGVYGAKVVVTRAGPDRIPFADYFANLIICEDRFFDDRRCTAASELVRMLKPCGGVALISRPAGAETQKTPPPKVKQWIGAFLKGLQKVGDAKSEVAGNWTVVTRGKLEGAGSWTHQYAETGNTACSDDQLVKGAIGVLWFGEPGPKQMPSRHASNVSPLAVGGRLFVQGENVVMAYDAYNGLRLWERPMAGALRLHLKGAVSNLAANQDSLFVTIGDRCQRLDQVTGKTLKVYKTPARKDDKHPNWRYVACVGDLLYGTTQSGRLFALDIESGKVRWTHDAKSLMETTVCMSAGRLFFVDRSVTKEQREAGLKGIDPKMRIDTRGKPIPPDVRLVVALSAETGQVLWQQPQYVADCVKIGRTGGELMAMVANDVLLLCGQPWNGHFWKEFFEGAFSRRSLIALSAKDGAPLWSGRKGYRSRPLIVGDQIIAEPWAHDLYTGAPKMRRHPVTGAEAQWQMARPGHHCGNIAACTNALFFRSGSTGYYDLNADHGTAHFGAQRPGCWINCIPASGVITMPEASSGCVCPFALVTTVTFQPRKARRVWGMFSAPGPMTPVKHLAVNFGAPGDRRDSGGALWLAYPRPYHGRLVVDLKLDVTAKPPGGTTYVRTDANFVEIAATDDPWLHATALAGCARLTIPLSDKAGDQAAYTVRLYFSAPEGDRPGRRVFDVALQGKTVLANFDIAKRAGGTKRELIREFKGVRAGRALTLELTAKADEVTAATRPLLSGVEIVRE